MVFKRLQDSQDSLYLQAMQLYQTSFPLHEQRKPDAQRAILQEPDYQFNLLMEEDHLLGELLCWETQEFIYVEHLCILPIDQRYDTSDMEYIGNNRAIRTYHCFHLYPAW